MHRQGGRATCGTPVTGGRAVLPTPWARGPRPGRFLQAASCSGTEAGSDCTLSQLQSPNSTLFNHLFYTESQKPLLFSLFT